MIDVRGRRILVDGRPSLVLSGEVHYFRVARDAWADRLDRVLEIGCTCVASYIPWLFHELPDGSIDVTGQTRPERDLGAFVDLCAERGLDFFARPGPFVMAELKNEGLPYRLYTEHPEIVPVGWDGKLVPTRAVDYLAPAFLAEADRWYAAQGNRMIIAGLRLRTTVPGVVVTTAVSPRAERMLHVLNPTSYPATVEVDVEDPTGLLARPLAVPPYTGRMLGLGLQLPSGATIVSSNAEVTGATESSVRFGVGLGDRTEVWLRSDRRVWGPEVRAVGHLTVVLAPPGDGLEVTFD